MLRLHVFNQKYIKVSNIVKSVLHDPSEIILIFWFGAQETFLYYQFWKHLGFLNFLRKNMIFQNK